MNRRRKKAELKLKKEEKIREDRLVVSQVTDHRYKEFKNGWEAKSCSN